MVRGSCQVPENGQENEEADSSRKAAATPWQALEKFQAARVPPFLHERLCCVPLWTAYSPDSASRLVMLPFGTLQEA